MLDVGKLVERLQDYAGEGEADGGSSETHILN